MGASAHLDDGFQAILDEGVEVWVTAVQFRDGRVHSCLENTEFMCDITRRCARIRAHLHVDVFEAGFSTESSDIEGIRHIKAVHGGGLPVARILQGRPHPHARVRRNSIQNRVQIL